jgi:hypothetical protein
MKSFNLDIVESEVTILLEALTEMERRMENVCATSEDEDEIADVGNDLIEVRLLLKSLQEKAIKQYGNNIVNFSREPL